MRRLKLIIALLLLALSLILVAQNTEVVTVHLLFWELAMSQVVLLPLVLLAGFILGYLVAKLTGHRRSP